MAAGDLLILRNSSDTSNVPNAGGGNLDAVWDIVDRKFGAFTNSNGTVTLPAGIYLVMYSEYFVTSETTNNERIEIQGEIHTASGGVQGGYGQEFIRKSSGDQEGTVSGYMILELPSQQDVFIRFYRTDDSNDGTVRRTPGFGGMTILELDDAHNYGIYSTSANESTSGTTERILNLTTTERQNTGFTRTGASIDVASAGRYLITYSIDISQTATGREDVVSRLTSSGLTIPGSHGYCYLRGSDGGQDGALTWIGVVDLPTGSDLDVRWSSPTSSTITASAGARLGIWQLPSGNATVIKEATTGDYNADADFSWDTTPHLDTTEFSNNSASEVGLNNDGAFLAFATFKQFAPDTVQRGVPLVRTRLDGVLSNRSSGTAYHRNSGGSGRTAITVADSFFVENPASTLRINTFPNAAAGSMTNDDGQFSVLSLNSVFGVYAPPPAITDVDGDNQILIGTSGADVTGTRFGSVQGSGRLEFWSDSIGTIKVVQSVNSWTDTSINFDFVQGGLTNNTFIYAVVVDDAGEVGTAFSVFLGVPTLTSFFDVISALPLDHWWRFDNDGYADSVGVNPITAIVFGNGGAFVSEPITMQSTHSWRLNDQDNSGRREPSNSSLMNTAALQTRTMGGWVRFAQIDTALSCVYEEGGGVNNVCFLLGMGNILIASYADTGDDNAQAFSDFPLDPNRDYFIVWRFDHTAPTPRFELIIDGVLQSETTGNPLTSGDLDSHSGDITFGGQGSSLEVGGTDVTFRAQLDTKYAHWWSSRGFISDGDLLNVFQRGALPVDTISSGTPAAMQAAITAFTGTTRANAAMDFRVEEPESGLEDNLSLSLDGIVFDDRTSIQIEWRGAGILTITNLNGSNVDASKCVSLRGGAINVVNPAIVTLTGLQNPTEVRVYEAGTTNEVAGQEDVTTGTFSASIQVSAVDIVVHSLGFRYQRLENVDTGSGNVSLPIQQRADRQYLNP